MEDIARNILQKMPDWWMGALLPLKLMPKGLFLYLLNPDNPVSHSLRNTAYKEYVQKYPDQYQGRWLYLQFLWRSRMIDEAENLLGQLKKQFGARPELYKLEVRMLMRKEGISMQEALRAVYYSTPYQKYLDLVENSKELRAPLRCDSIIIVTHGRTGSTLLQGILNSIPGVEIKGENYNALYHLFNFYRAYQRTGKNHPWAVLPKHPFYHQATGEKELALLDRCRDMVLDYFDIKENPKVFGFKEIRYFNIIKDTPAYLNFLQRILPNPLFVFLERDLEEVVQSAWWKDHRPEQIKSKFRQLYRSFDQFKTKHPQKSYTLSYQDLIQKTARLQGLFDCIGAPYDPDLIDFVLSVPHSYAPKKKNKAHHFGDFPI